MRIYNSCVEMMDETYREIWKRGQTIFDKTVQGKIVSEKDFEQKELIFYNFRVDNFEDLKAMLNKTREMFNKPQHDMQVAEAWLFDMVYNESLHETWWDLNENTRKYFKDFCEDPKGSGNASYSYGERIIPQIQGTIERLKTNKYSRGACIVMTKPDDINKIGHRVPCTISYHFICRPTLNGDKLNLIVNMRSADAINFFPLDFAKSVLFLDKMAVATGLSMGSVIMNVDTLHVYALDVPEVFKW